MIIKSGECVNTQVTLTSLTNSSSWAITAKEMRYKIDSSGVITLEIVEHPHRRCLNGSIDAGEVYDEMELEEYIDKSSSSSSSHNMVPASIYTHTLQPLKYREEKANDDSHYSPRHDSDDESHLPVIIHPMMRAIVQKYPLHTKGHLRPDDDESHTITQKNITTTTMESMMDATPWWVTSSGIPRLWRSIFRMEQKMVLVRRLLNKILLLQVSVLLRMLLLAILSESGEHTCRRSAREWRQK